MAIISVVKYDGSPDVFAWKYPDDELGLWSQLIVNESQQAILLEGGEIVGVFESGHHTLNSKNIPFLENIINIPFGGESPFKVEVWFVNKVFALDVKWGTPSPIQIQDPTYKILVPVRSNGIFGISIDDPKKFLVKLVGTLPSFTKQDIANYFKGLYITRAKDAISTYILEQGIDVLNINMYLDELSSFLEERISPVMSEYGISLTNFFVNDISIPDNDPAVVKLRDSLAKKAEMDIIGFNYVQERSFDTLEGAATNQGSDAASVMGAGMGMGMGFGMGTGMGGAFSGIAQNLNILGDLQSRCPRCGSLASQGQRFCGYCGAEIIEALSQNAVSMEFCGACGSSFPSGCKFCPQCGQSVHVARSSDASSANISSVKNAQTSNDEKK